MAYEVTVQNDTFPDDHEFEIVGLGAFKNGESREITEEQERTFVALYQMPLEDRVSVDRENAAVSVSGSSAIENIDDILGKDISDRPEPPQKSILENDSVSEDDPAKRVLMGLPAVPLNEDDMVVEGETGEVAKKDAPLNTSGQETTSNVTTAPPEGGNS